MKKIILLFVLISGFTFGQSIPEFQFSNKGFNNNLVFDVPNIKKEEIYKKTIEWIKLNYNSPEKVIKSQIEDQYIRINGFNNQGICNKMLGTYFCWGLYYTLEIHIKDDKYKLILSEVYTYEREKTYVDIYQKTLYDRKGNLKKSGEPIFNSLNKTINNVSSGLYDYVIGKTNINSNW